MNSKIKELVARFGKDGSFTKVPPTKAMLEEAKNKLGFPVPKQFLEYLDTYSEGGFGFEILGVGFDGSMSFLDETLDYRNDGLPENLLVVENCDEWLYCIDSNTDEIVSWYPDGEVYPAYPCFDDFLLARIDDAIENM